MARTKEIFPIESNKEERNRETSKRREIERTCQDSDDESAQGKCPSLHSIDLRRNFSVHLPLTLPPGDL